jgi:large subunit ribosomal protein L24
MRKSNIRKKDTVIVLSGRDKGKKGEVVRIYPETGRVLVTKVNMVTKHARPTQTAPGGLQKIEAPLPISKVALVCPKCSQPMRPKRDRLASGERVRLCRKCGEVLV